MLPKSLLPYLKLCMWKKLAAAGKPYPLLASENTCGDQDVSYGRPNNEPC